MIPTLEDRAGRSSQLRGRESGGKASRRVVLPEHPKAAAHPEREDLLVPLWMLPEILKSHHTLSLGSDKLQKCPLCFLTKPPGRDARKVLTKKLRELEPLVIILRSPWTADTPEVAVMSLLNGDESWRADGIDSLVSKPNYRNAKCRGRGNVIQHSQVGESHSSLLLYLFHSGPQRVTRCSPTLGKAICFLESIHLNANLSWKYFHRHTQEY